MKNFTKSKLSFEKVSIAKLSDTQMQHIVGGGFKNVDEFNNHLDVPAPGQNAMKNFPTETVMDSYFCKF